MILHHSITALPETAKGSVLAIGNFDGLHLGHRALLAAARDIADAQNATLAALTFEPHPREFLGKTDEPFRLTLLPMKARLLESLNVDHLFALGFDASLAALPAEAFIRDILIEKLAAKHVVVGHDFSFGKNRSGTVDTLRARGFGLTVIDAARCEGRDIYSSTRIRALVKSGDLEKAAQLMGHPFEMEAEIVKGDQRGRTIGYPTANQRVARYVRMPYGIYAVRVLIEGEGEWRAGVASYGIRPMFEVDEPLLETYIFDFNREIYEKTMRVRPAAFLRPEMKFDGLEALKSQITQDCARAKACLQST